MTINMTELDGKEKYYDLPNNLPVKTLPFDTIESGDLMLYDSNTRVVFYKTFSNTYSYTRLGRIDNSLGLAQALGTDHVRVTFDLKHRCTAMPTLSQYHRRVETGFISCAEAIRYNFPSAEPDAAF